MRIGWLTTIWAVVFWVWTRPRPSWVEGASLPVIVGAMVAVGGVIAVAGGTAVHTRYLEASLLAAAPAIIILPVSRAWTITACVTALAVYGMASFAHPLVNAKDTVAFGTFSLLIFGSLVPARHAINLLLLHGYMLTLRDALKEMALRDANERLAVLAATDDLTGLANRRAFEAMAGELWHETAPSPSLGVMLLDIDRFKQLNDTAGHGRGDACLVAIAETIREALPEARIVARYGGEEFAALFTDASPRALMGFADRARRAVEERAFPHPGLGAGRCVTVSVGLSLAASDGGEMDLSELVRRADDALYRAKAEGRNRCAAVWSPSSMILNTQAPRRSA
jgi:diguanylate cyclase (GGDEF)-like protein